MHLKIKIPQLKTSSYDHLSYPSQQPSASHTMQDFVTLALPSLSVSPRQNIMPQSCVQCIGLK